VVLQQPKERENDVRTFVKLTENNEHEGETWHFYIPYEGNEEAIGQLFEAIALLDQDVDEEHSLDMTPIPEVEVDILVKHADTGYMANHNKLTGVLTLPDDFDEKMADEYADPLYKGSIKEYMKVTENA
jgi:hypothetical protein